MNLKVQSWILLLVLGLFTACVQPEKPGDKISENAVAEYFIKDTIGVFRETEPGDDIEVVMQLEENSNLILNDSVRVIYKYYISNNRYYTVAYTFQNKILSEICFDLILDTEEEANTITESMAAFYDKKYGPHIMDMGYFVWKIPVSGKGTKANLDLKDESSEYGYGKLNLTVYSE